MFLGAITGSRSCSTDPTGKWILGHRARISLPASTVQIRPARRRRHIRRSSLDGADLLPKVSTRYETKAKEMARIWRASPIRTADLHTASDVTRKPPSSGTSRPSISSATTVRCDPRVHPHVGISKGRGVSLLTAAEGSRLPSISIPTPNTTISLPLSFSLSLPPLPSFPALHLSHLHTRLPLPLPPPPTPQSTDRRQPDSRPCPNRPNATDPPPPPPRRRHRIRSSPLLEADQERGFWSRIPYRRTICFSRPGDRLFVGFRLVILLVLCRGSMSGGRAAGNRAPQPAGQIRQPPKRHLPFPSTRPPFLAPDEYHRFPGPDGRGIAGDETADALVIKTPVSFPLKRKREHEDNEAAESSEWMTSPGYAEGLNNLLLTPVSGKGGKTSGRSKIAKYNKSGPHTPMSNAGDICFLCLQAGDYLQRRYRIVLRSTMGPIDVYLVSDFYFYFLQTDADYWLLSDSGFSITDMWKTAPEVQWDGIDVFNTDDFVTGSASTYQPQTPSSVTNVPSNANSTPR
ncbi:hypothetical protein BHE74_00005320 [Ensete ventricosum]|nr:hypothetical protein BHE74_00005320 [Ensete ventricosum]